jgi:hypothetical protein
MIEELYQEQNCLFRRGDYINKGYKPKKFVLDLRPGENAFVSRKLSTIEEWRLDQNCFFSGREITGQKPKTPLGSSPGEYVEFRDIIFHDILRYVSNVQVFGQQRSIRNMSICLISPQ